MRIQKLTPTSANFQLCYVPEKLFNSENEKQVTSTAGASPATAQFLGVSLESCKRRLLLRRSLHVSPDVSSVLPCDLRVQQLLWNDGFESSGATTEPLSSSGSRVPVNEAATVEGNERSSKGGGGGATDTDSGEEKHPAYYGDGVSQEDGGMEREAATSPLQQQGGNGVPTSGRKRNDYRREIDLAHHILQMKRDGGDDEDGYSGSGGAGGRNVAEEQRTATSSSTELFQRVPSTVRFNDALVCTSKDAQILKSGAIKMMRLTVICHSDLHYYQQNHRHPTRKSQQNHQQSQKYFGNKTTAKGKEEIGDVVTFARKETPATTQIYSTSPLSSSAKQVVGERKEDGDGSRCEKKPTSTPTRQTISPDDEENEKKEDGKSQKEKNNGDNIMSSEVSSSSSFSSSYPPPSHHHSNQDRTALNGNSGECKTNWKRLQEKIRVIFQTYDIHVGPNTLVDLKGCPLASFQAKFVPAIRFIFVEECEMIMKSKKTDAAAAATPIDIGRVSGKSEIIITNVHHISYYERLVEMTESQAGLSDNNVHLYGLEHAAKILNGMIKTSGGGSGGIGQVENPVVPVTYTTSTSPAAATSSCAPSPSSSALLTEFSHGILISGPSGCGKVVVVRETARKLGAHLLSFNPSAGVEDYGTPSQFCQQLTEIFTSALATASRYRTVLLFPRIHLLFQQKATTNSPSASGKNYNKTRVLHHLCKLSDSIPAGYPLTVVGTTDKTFLVPLELRRAGRLEKEIIISPPKESDRLSILQELSRKIPAFNKMDFSEIASQTPGYVAQDLLKVLRLALFKCQEDACRAATEDEVLVSEAHLRYAVRRVVPSVLEGALGVVDIQRAISLDHIAGLHSVKLDLIKAIVWPLKHPEAFLRMGISPPKGILLYGPPGNCKTTLVRAVAATHQTNFLSVSAAELFSSGVGDSEKIVAHLFHRARMASPCILFIDELESIVGSRQNSEKKQSSTNESILSMLLTEMDGVGTTRIHHQPSSSADVKSDNDGDLKRSASLGPLVLVVAATNRPDLIDPALLRPGRFDKLIGVPPLDMAGRRELLEWCSKSIPFDQNVNFEQVARDTEYFSGADLVNLCREAALFALSDSLSASFVSEQHVKMARGIVNPSLSPGMIRAFHEYGSSLQQQKQK